MLNFPAKSSFAARTETPTVDIVIPTLNEEGNIGRLLEALRAQDYPAHCISVFVVDRHSTDRTRDIAADFGATVLTTTGSTGVGRNTGIRAGSGEFVGLLDGDVIPERNWVSSQVNAFSKPDIGASVSGVWNFCESPFADWMAQRAVTSTPESLFTRTVSGLNSHLPWAVMGTTMIRRRVVEQAGLFDPTELLLEDVDLSWRIVKLGYRLVINQQTSVEHHDVGDFVGYLRKFFRYGAGAALLARKHGLKAPRYLGKQAGTLQAELANLILRAFYIAGFWRMQLSMTMRGNPFPREEPVIVLEELRPSWLWSNEVRLQISRNILFWDIAAEHYVALNTKTNKRYQFSDSAVLIFTALTRGDTRAQIVSMLMDEHDGDEKEFEEHLDQFVESLIAEGVVNRTAVPALSRHAAYQ